jgi:hypothetical protein
MTNNLVTWIGVGLILANLFLVQWPLLSPVVG